MAENKKSFLLYCDLIHTVKKLPDEKAGQLFKHILSYVNDEHPETDDVIIELTFEPIKQQFKRDLEKWRQRSERNRENARKRWAKDEANGSDRIQSDAKDADTVSVIDNGNDTDNETVPLKKEEVKFSFHRSLIKEGFEKELVSDWLKCRQKKKLANTKTALAGFLKEIEKAGGDKNEILRLCIEKGWGGFKANWLKNEEFTSNTQKRTSGSGAKRQDFQG